MPRRLTLAIALVALAASVAAAESACSLAVGGEVVDLPHVYAVRFLYLGEHERIRILCLPDAVDPAVLASQDESLTAVQDAGLGVKDELKDDLTHLGAEVQWDEFGTGMIGQYSEELTVDVRVDGDRITGRIATPSPLEGYDGAAWTLTLELDEPIHDE